MKMTTTAAGIFAAAALAGCTTSEPELARLEGVLGYAEFILRCNDSIGCDPVDDPVFAVGSTLDFDVTVRSDFPFHESGEHVDIHQGDRQFVEGDELQTVMAISNHSDGYLIDYAFVTLRQANNFQLEPTSSETLQSDEEGYVIPLADTVSGRAVAYHDGDRLLGRIDYDFRALDPEIVDLHAAPSATFELLGRRPGVGRLEVSALGHTQIFSFRVLNGNRTTPSPPDEPLPPRTNPSSDDTDTDASTGGTDASTGGTDGDTDASTGTATTGGGR